MDVNKRERREFAGVPRAPRSGGRTAAQRTTRAGGGTPHADRMNRLEETRARGAHEYLTQGSAALRPVEKAGAAEQANPPRLRVAPPPPVKAPRAPFAALVVVLVVGGVLGILAVNTKINENAFRLEKLQQQQARLDVEQQQLKKQIAEAEAPGNLAAEARRLGLVESGEPAYIRLPDGKVIGVPQPADGQPSVTSQQGAEG
ncbi:Septum formation initiator [Micromonospora nigra]|uniref:Septum formation initiator n=1 Tax=Micromonospora nigra TaxID=145857 RepID=A0A1C6RG45_9ACTN|nr:septum formation initiator family protein [Micromonospora nigra]SCL16051.1 Septum formation initiator [Micromonospora nigra]